MSEQINTVELLPNGLPVDMKDWSEEQLMESYIYLQDRPLNELNAAAMLDISRELDDRKNRQ